MMGRTSSAYSCWWNWVEDRTEASRLRKCCLSIVSSTHSHPGGVAHSSPLRNSAVRNKCSRERVADKTPPNNSVSLTVFNADPCSVVYQISSTPTVLQKISAHLESKRLQNVSSTRFRLVSTSSLDNNSNARCSSWGTRFDTGDLDSGSVGYGSVCPFESGCRPR
jgi:hypothetical protein